MTRKKVAAFIIAVLSLFSIGLLTAPGASATAVSTMTEYYQCGNIHNDATHVYATCDGVWYNGPRARDLRILADASVIPQTGWRTVSVRYVDSLQNVGKIIHWYCRYANGTTTGLKGSTSIGGGLAHSYSWSPYYHPCDGTSLGLVAVAIDRPGTIYASTSTIDINTDDSGILWHKGVESY